MPDDVLYRLWAKTNDRDRAPGEAWARHPLPCHLLDVGAVAEAWLDADPHLLGRFCALWPAGPEPDAMRRLLAFAAAAHDVGKADARFQAKSAAGWAHGYGASWAGPLPNGRGFDHGHATGRLFAAFAEHAGRWRVPSASDVLADLMQVAAGHHGSLYASTPPVDVPAATDAAGGAVRAAVALLADVFGPVPELPDETPPAGFLMLAAGFVSVADWLGSDGTFFPFTPGVATEADAHAYAAGLREASARRDERVGAYAALRASGLVGAFRSEAQSFEALFGFAPRAGFQAAAVAVPFGCEAGAEIAVVEAPMGLGKTEVALALAGQALSAGTASGVYVALPTQASANALFGRVERFAERTRAEGTELALALAHGARRFHRDYRRMLARTGRASFERSRGGATDDASPPSETVAPAWLQTSKRSLLAPVGLGTVDQAMLGAMSVRHGFVRLFALAGKVVVLDEIHAYDTYMRAILEHLLAWLGALGCKVVLLSATLPQGGRQALVRAYGAVPPDEGAPHDVPYPQLVWAAPGRAAAVVAHPVGTEFERRVAVECIEADDSTAAGVAWTMAAAARGGCVAWIRNTVREAQEAHAALVAAGVPAVLLHARFTRADRNAKEEALIDALGPPRDDASRATPRRGVVVATQVIEQSVDVDVDAMLSDLAPADLLLQRAGRLHRHARPAAAREGHPTAVLAVLVPGMEARAALRFGASAYVYDAETLARSAVLVAEQAAWALPAACRTLVAALYDSDGTWTAERLGCDAARLDALRARSGPRAERDEMKGKGTLVSPPRGVPFAHDPRRDGSDDTAVALATRLGGRSLTLTLLVAGPKGTRFHGQTRLARAPKDTPGARMKTEEAVALASVSLPWYAEVPEPPPLPDPAAAFAQGWRERHRFDDRVFVLLDAHGRARLGDVDLAYATDTGLISVKRTPDAPASVPFDAL